jgi:dipeptidyl aminopeptidase/acylaminoacyl peptidase
VRLFLSIAALALAGALSTPATAQVPPPIPTTDFAALPDLTDPILSPDGRTIVAQSTSEDKANLVFIDADRPEAAPRTISLGATTIVATHWAGNQRLLVTVFRTLTIGPLVIPMLRLVVIDRATAKARMADAKSHGMYAGKVLHTDPGGSWALVASQDDFHAYPSVKRVDLSTGIATLVEKARPGVWDWYVDDQGSVRAGIAYEGRRWTIWYRNVAGEPLYKLKGKFAKDDDGVVDRVIFGPGSTGWILTNQRTGRFALYKYDFASGALGEPVFEHPEVDLDAVTYKPFTGKIAAVSFHDDRSRTVWLDADRKAMQAKIDRALPGLVNEVVDWSDDDKRYLIRSGGASDPGRYFLLDRAANKMHPVIVPYQQLDPAKLAAVKAVRYQGRDGLIIPAYLTFPRGRDAKALPLIVMPHGGPFERDRWTYDPFVQFLANRGYAVLQPQFRGSTGYGKDFVARGYGEFGKKMQDDLDDGVDWLVRTGQVDPKRVCIVGMSYGGYAAMWGAIRNPERYRCAVSWAGVSDLNAQLKHSKKLFSATRYYREWRSKVGGEGKSDLAAVSPLSFVNRLRVPLLVAHGEEDATVPSSQSHSMVKAAAKAGAPVTSAFYKDSAHNFGSSADLDDFLKRLDQFLRTHNPG